MKKYLAYSILAVLILGGYSESKAQQSLRHSNYLFNKLILNPGAAGSNDYIEIMAGYRKDWAGFEGSPRSSFLSVDGSVLQKRIGLGLQVINEKLGAYESTGAVGTAAARVRLASESYLSFGISGGYFVNSLRGTELKFEDDNEIAIPTQDEQVRVFDMRAGVYYKDKRNFGGVSVFNVLEPVLNYTGNQRNVVSELSRHYYFLAGRIFRVNSDVDLIPSVMYKYSEKSQNEQVDFNLRAMYQNRIGLGLSYSSNSDVILLAEFFPTEFLRFGYAFNYATSDLRTNSSGSHEIMVAYRIIQNKRLTENPRYLYN
ncbi:PorP/SprF family type IX secretion system membrane protein [Luteibaculum oceani]|uniref:Type IX secretion system membrane protein PorP/SprF n=1 Tax=Luteibaculum oceani TaxID=1294296 RepID=A0A5C6VE37_9FLAO|nr:type IX secretion system membrane protein PorP/SprF [Luteibaculum oceani]TXC82025.1 type IX secretion system membrane protein PorP/SprF [Luteibaculum oceani]